MTEIDAGALQVLPGEELPGLGNCNWTCFLSGGGACLFTGGCWFTDVR